MLDGIEFRPETARAAVVHVHGSLGNFYHQPFLRVFAREWVKRGIALICYNLRSHDGIAEGYDKDGDMEYVGGSITQFVTCVEDIDAMLERANRISENVYLQGHSMGCDRVVFYKNQKRIRCPIILLSPCNSRRLQEKWLGQEKVQSQIQRLKARVAESSNSKFMLLSEEEYGVRAPDGWTYTIPVNRETLLGILEGPVCELFDVKRRPSLVDNGKAWVYLGESDPIRGCRLSTMERHIRQMFPSVLYKRGNSGGHGLEECTEVITEALADWILGTALQTMAR